MASSPVLIVGLGNPGVRYETTRHNVGFLLIDLLADQLRIDVVKSKFKGEMGRGEFEGHPIILLKPQTFMNLSGESAAAVCRFYKVPTKDVVVVQDDVDQESSKVKSRVGGGSGGHNGIKSMVSCLGSQEFHRLKVGVGKPENPRIDVADWVLSQLSDVELKALENSVFDDIKLRLRNFFKANLSCK